MRFIKNLYISALAVVAGALTFTSCQPEESPLSRAIMTSVSSLQFAAENAEPQSITVYADADWTVEAPEWVTVDKVSGSRTMDVTISVGDNMRDGAMDNPKKDTIVFRGYNLLAHAYVIVNQAGDKFRDIPASSVSDVLAMKDEAVVIFDDAQVVADATDGFVVSDGTANVFVMSDAAVSVGDKVDVWGSKGMWNDLPAVTVTDKVEVAGNAAVTYPTATDITASIDAYAPAGMEYVEVTGSLNGKNVKVEGATKVAAMYNPALNVDLNAMNGHNVTVKGYSAGVTASLVNMVVTEIVDLGVNEIIYFADNFDWLAEMAEGAGAGDSMGVDGDDSAKNAYTAATGFADLLASQGYEDLFPSSKTIYLQRNYLKFSKGSNANGIRFPSITYGGTTNVVLTFDWGVHVGSGGPDQTELVIEIEGNGTADKTSFTHTAGDWVWQTETVTISGIDDASRIVLKPSTFTGTATSGYYRWYLDNIKVVQGEGEAPAPVSKVVFEEDFEWIAPMAEADAAGDAVATDDPGATAPNVWKMTSSADFFAKFNELGYKYLYSKVGDTAFAEGPAQEPNTAVGKEGSLYIQKNYLKFGQTSYSGALVLPALSKIKGTASVAVEFDWCWQVTGGFKPDIMTLSVDASVGKFAESGGATSANLESTQSTVDAESHLAWQHVSIVLEGATAETVLTIRPTNADPDVQNAARHQNRWYLDNIKVTVQ